MKQMILLLLWTAVASAHSGERLYPIYELTDEMLEMIDLHDGLIDEWQEMGEPSMTLLDFKTVNNFIPADLANLDFRIWLAWHDELNRIYAAFVITDDEYKNTHDWEGNGLHRWIFNNDSVTLMLDADHSGGEGTRNETPIREYATIFGETQRYDAIAETQNGPTIQARLPEEFWPIFTTYVEGGEVDAGGGTYGENPVLSVIEFYVTPQDGWEENKAATPFSELFPNHIIGFAPIINDFDPSINQTTAIPWHPESVDDEGALYFLSRGEADIFLDGVLLPAQDTAVEAITWGRIKASLW